MATLPKKTRPVANRAALVEQLARRFSDQIAKGQPRITWNPSPVQRKSDVAVLWDRWKGIPFSERSEIILEACDRSRQGLKDQVYIATGRTTEEAITLGYLPFRIAPVAQNIRGEDWGQIEKALSEEGAVETSEGPQLRFASFDEAQDAFVRLQSKVPGPYWTIVEEVVRES